jgi:Zn-dependent metalloprotease
MTACRALNCIVPPHILDKLLQNGDPEIRDAAMRTLLTTTRLRGQRDVRGLLLGLSAPTQGRRTVFDCKQSTVLSDAEIARTEEGPESHDASVNRAFDGFGATRQFYLEVLGRNSIDDRGMRLDGYVHRGVGYNNAFWDGQQMVFGDGDGLVFSDFTGSLDVIAHELTHGVTEFTSGFVYHNQPGALNESMSDVKGALVKQWAMQQTADQADWLIGSEIFTPGIEADALRSMKAPGHAYDNEMFGRDPQPDHMDRYVELPDTDEGDNGGVHINSGIPNHAFYLAAVAMGGHAWERAGRIWYESLRASTPTTEFEAFAATTVSKAGEMFGGDEQEAVRDAWSRVGIEVSGGALGGAGGLRSAPGGNGTSAAVARDIDELSAQLTRLRQDLHLPGQ